MSLFKNNILNIKFIVPFFLLNIFIIAAYAQDKPLISNKTTEVKIIKGKKYYMHTVLKGQTIYNIAKIYEVTEEDIFKENPKAKESIKSGQILKIPVKKENDEIKISKKSSDKEKKYFIHTVEKGETLRKIAKKYLVSVKEIEAINPNIIPNEIKAGQKIKIPINKKNSGMIPVAKDTISIALPKDTIIKISCDNPKLQDVYNVALMIPLYLNNVNDIIVNNGEKNSIKDVSLYKSFTFLQFYEGAMIALDSLKKLGFSCKLYVYDVNEDTAKTIKILQKPELSKMHLIIGPFFSKSIALVAKFAKKYDINVIDPLSIDTLTLWEYNNVFKVNTPYRTQLQTLSQFIATQFADENIIVVHNNKDSELSTLNTIRYALNEAMKNNGKGEASFKEIVYSPAGISGIIESFIPDKKNIVITLMTGELFITSYFTQFNNYKDNYDIIIVGMPAWRLYENIEIEYFVNLNLHMFSNNFIDYDDSNVKKFISDFRTKYVADPNKFAFQGYDIVFYFLSALKKYGKNFEECISKLMTTPLQTSFNFTKINNDGGYENKFVNVYRYEDYKLVNAQKPMRKKEIKK